VWQGYGLLAAPYADLLGGSDELTVFNDDTHLLTGQEPGVLDPQTGELDPGVKLRWFVQV